ncbi:hypothetical protein P3T22_001620 [Paraburkholderia sp. GAS348]
MPAVSLYMCVPVHMAPDILARSRTATYSPCYCQCPEKTGKTFRTATQKRRKVGRNMRNALLLAGFLIGVHFAASLFVLDDQHPCRGKAKKRMRIRIHHSRFASLSFLVIYFLLNDSALAQTPVYGNRGQCNASLPRIRRTVTVSAQQQNADMSITAQLDCQPYPIHVPSCAIISESQTAPHVCPCPGCGNVPPSHIATYMTFWDFP